jgi:hypothetical protein
VASGLPSPVSEGAFAGRAAQQAAYDVYYGLVNGERAYVGITNNLLRKAIRCAYRMCRTKGGASFVCDLFPRLMRRTLFGTSYGSTLGTLAATEAFGTMPKTPDELRAFGLPKSEINPYTCQANTISWASCEYGLPETEALPKSH